MTSIDRLVQYLSKLPGIGKKSAARLAYHILETDYSYAQGLSESIIHMKKTIGQCKECGNYSEDELCDICSNPGRDKSIICVVEQAQDIAVLESVQEYHGLYHVLHGVLSPLDGVGPEELKIDRLLERIDRFNSSEVILATNPTVEGDTTALFLKRMLEPKDVKVTRPALGLPVGGDLEYTDRLTLIRSFRGRTELG